MKRLIHVVAALAMLVSSAFASAQTYPTRPVRIVVPFPPGGAVDFVARVVAQKLTESFGQTVLVENRAGANSAIGSQFVSQSAPDGHTLLVNASIFIYSPLLAKAPYDPLVDFTPIALVARGALVMSVANDLPVKDVNSLAAYAKANPGKINFAVGSIGSAGHLAQELYRTRAGGTWTTIPYRGAAPAYADLMAGNVQAFTDPAAASIPHAKAGKIRAIAVTSSQRMKSLPDLPTLAEQGFPGFEFYSWWGLYGPPNMPRELTTRINEAVNKVTRERDVIERFEVQAVETVQWSAEQFAKFQADDSALARKIIRDSNIKPE
jgi:tripartite-type tricarboxylate transporter receptor subunit TctC